MAKQESAYQSESELIPRMINLTKLKNSDAIIKLTKELIEVYNQIKLNYFEFNKRTVVFNKYKKIIENEFECIVEPYGSYKTRTMVDKSDIDITILCNSTEKYNLSKEYANEILSRVYMLLIENVNVKKSIIHIRKAKIPIIKFCDLKYGYNIDISVNKIDAIENANYMIKELEKKPDMRYFIILLKYFMKLKRLSDASTGGLCAYAQFLMILNFLQVHPLVRNDNPLIGENLGSLFMDFFQFYGIDFPYEKLIISVLGHGSKINNTNGIYIEDPMKQGNNVARVCIFMSRIQHLYLYSYRIMLRALLKNIKIDSNKRLVTLWFQVGEENKDKAKKMQLEM